MLTVSEAIQEEIGIEVSEKRLQKSLMDVQTEEAEVNINDPYYPSDHMAIVDLAAINVLQSLLSVPDFSEGGISIKYDKKGMEARLKELQVRQGVYVDSAAPTIEDISNYW